MSSTFPVNDTLKYTTTVQLPLILSLNSVLWVMVIFRAYIVWRSTSWRNWQGASTAVVILAAILCSTYLPLIKISKIMSNDLDRFGKTSTVYIECAARIVLAASLWGVKLALLLTLYESRPQLTKDLRLSLRWGTFFITLTFFSVVVLLVISLAQKIGFTIGAWDLGIDPGLMIMDGEDLPFVFNVLVELISTFLNMLTDVFLLVLSLKVIGVLSSSCAYARGRSPSMFVAMTTITLSVATARLGLAVWFSFLKGQIDNTSFAHEEVLREERYLGELTSARMVAYQVLSELEAFFAVAAATLPAVRAIYRLKHTQGKEDELMFCAGEREQEVL